MPEHFQALIWSSERADPSRIVQSLKERMAKFILKNLQTHRELPWCGRMLDALTLPPTVHLHGPYRAWQRRPHHLLRRPPKNALVYVGQRKNPRAQLTTKPPPGHSRLQLLAC